MCGIMPLTNPVGDDLEFRAVELNYSLSEDEFQEAQIVPRLFMLRFQMVLASFIVLSMLLVFWFRGTRDIIAWWFFLVGIFLLVDRYALARYRVTRMFRRSPNTSSERSVSIGRDGIKVVMPNANEEVQWSAFQKARELKKTFLVYNGPKSFYIFPKRAFTSEHLEEFRALLREKRLL